MRIELHCPNCVCFTAPPETRAEEIIERMQNEGTLFGLGEGATFEDMIFTTLTEHGAINCPECGEPVTVSEASLNQMAMELLAQW